MTQLALTIAIVVVLLLESAYLRDLGFGTAVRRPMHIGAAFLAVWKIGPKIVDATGGAEPSAEPGLASAELPAVIETAFPLIEIAFLVCFVALIMGCLVAGPRR